MATHVKPRRRFKVLLVVSLTLNLLFVGVFAGAVWRNAGPDGQARRGPALQNYAAPYVQALPRDERRALHRAMRADHPKPDRKARYAVYAQMLAALRAAPFDPGAVQSVLDGQRDASVGVQQAAQDQWMMTVTAMSAEERAAYADSLEERLKRGPRSKGKKRDSGN